MEYTVNKLARLSGVTTRTLRYYDEIGLLKPARISSNGYRVYTQKEVDLLQQILFYRELGVNLEDIKGIVLSSDFDCIKALETHLIRLEQRKQQIDGLIHNVRKTLCSMKGETTMSDTEKFEGFKKQIIEENEKNFGDEIREKYGEDVVENSNKIIMDMSKEKWEKAEKIRICAEELLKKAVENGNPADPIAQEMCKLHGEWISMFWENGTYSKAAHKAMGEMYVSDERFKAYYDNIVKGGAEFLNEALKIYCK